MPATPRSSKKSLKIVENLIGTQPNRINVSTKRRKQLERKLTYTQTRFNR